MNRPRFGDKASERALGLGLDFAAELGKLTGPELQTLAVEFSECADDPQEYVWRSRVLKGLRLTVEGLLQKTTLHDS